MSENQAKNKETSDQEVKPVTERKGLGKEIKIGMGVIGVLAVVLVALVVRRLSGPSAPPFAAIPPAQDPRADALLNDALEAPTILPATSAVDVPQPYAIKTKSGGEDWQTSSPIQEADAATARHLMPQQPQSSPPPSTGINQAPGSSRDDAYELPSRYAAPVNDGLNTIPTPSYRDATAVEAVPADPLSTDAIPETPLADDLIPSDSLSEATLPAAPVEFDELTSSAVVGTNPATLDSTGSNVVPYESRVEPSVANKDRIQPPLTQSENLKFTSPSSAAAGLQQVAATSDPPIQAAETPAQVAELSIQRAEPPIQIVEPAAQAVPLPTEVAKTSPVPEYRQPTPIASGQPVATQTSGPLAATQSLPAQLPPRELPTTQTQKTEEAPSNQIAQTQAVRGVYVVAPGDNFWTISEKLYGTDAFFKALYEHNRDAVADPNRLRVGNQLVTPPTSELARLYPELCPLPRSTIANVPSEPQGPVAQQSAETYVSQEGDTLYDIARQQLGDGNLWPHIYHLNRQTLGADLDYLAPGTQLTMPAGQRDELARQPSGAVRR